MKDPEWNLIRKVTYWTLLSLDGKIDLPPGTTMPTNIRELDFYARGLSFEFQLDQTLQLTSETLRQVAANMGVFHRLAAAIIVNAPSPQEIAALQADLEAISNDLKRDQRFKAGVALAGAVAGVVGQLRA